MSIGAAALRERIKSRLPLPVTSAFKGVRSSIRAWRWRMRRHLQHTLPSGLRVEIGSFSDWVVYNEVFVDGEYDAVIDAVIQTPRPQVWTLDLGANVGMFTLRLMDRWLRSSRSESRHHVICVGGAFNLPRSVEEPVPAATRVLLHAAPGAGRTTMGTASISTSAHTGVNSIENQSPSFSRVHVPFVDITQLLPPDARIALLKCDIEGAEELFLSNYADLLLRVDEAVVELHHQFCSPTRCRELLARAGLDRRTVLKTYGDDCTLEWFSRAG